MGKMSKATLETKVKELEMFLKIATKENKQLKAKIKELESMKTPTVGRKAFNDEETIKKMFSLYLNGFSLQEISNELDRLGLKTARGKSWSKSSLSLIMKKESSKNIVGEKIYYEVLGKMQGRQANKRK